MSVLERYGLLTDEQKANKLLLTGVILELDKRLREPELDRATMYHADPMFTIQRLNNRIDELKIEVKRLESRSGHDIRQALLEMRERAENLIIAINRGTMRIKDELGVEHFIVQVYDIESKLEALTHSVNRSY